MKTKIFYGYIILEFILCGLSYIASLNTLPVSGTFFEIISVSLNIPFLLTVSPRNKKDKLFGLIFSSLIVTNLVLSFLNISFIFQEILYIVAFLGLILRTSTEEDTLFKKTLLVSPFVVVGSLLFKILGLLSWDYVVYMLLSLLILGSIVLMIIMYYKSPIKEKQNWFFGFAGAIFLLIWLGVKTFAPLLNIESSMYEMFILLENIIFIPSIWMINISFIYFEPQR